VAAPTIVSRVFPSWNRSILTEIYLCHACSDHEIEDGNARTGDDTAHGSDVETEQQRQRGLSRSHIYGGSAAAMTRGSAAQTQRHAHVRQLLARGVQRSGGGETLMSGV
jgi:hypothetical protein